MTPQAPDAPWPFADPPNTAVFTCWRILRGEEWIHYVAHDADDGAWQFHPHGFAPESEAAVIGLGEMVALDPTVAALADLPPGWCAWRDRKDEPWQRTEASGRMRLPPRPARS